MRVTSTLVLSIVVFVVLAVQLASLGDVLEYRRAVAWTEPWRLFTGHFVHITLVHALLNAVALLLLGRLFADRLRRAELWTLLAAAPVAISLSFRMLMPELDWYRGMSGVLHSIYFAGCVAWVAETTGRARWLPTAALIGGAIKVLIEQPWDASFPHHEWLRIAVVPQAHLIGAIVGTAAGLWIKHVRRPARQ